MRQALRESWEGRTVCLVNDGEKAAWLAALLTELEAQVVPLAAPEGLPTPVLLQAALTEHPAEVLVLPNLPMADTPEALAALLYRLSECLRIARDAGISGVLLLLDDAAYRDAHAPWGCLEGDLLGGRNAAGCAAACARLLAEGYRSGFYGAPLPVVVAHHGLLTYGDAGKSCPAAAWAEALLAGQTPPLPYPGAATGWQHPLEPLAGALLAMGRVLRLPKHLGETWNFGIPPENWLTERRALAVLAACCGAETSAAPPERTVPPRYPRLDSTQARRELGWRTVYDAEETLRLLMAWHMLRQQRDAADVRRAQVAEYLARLGRAVD